VSFPQDLLVPVFPKVHVTALLRHFSGMIEDYQKDEWEDSLAKGGKFIEAALKALLVRAGKTPAKGKHFKAGTAIDELAGVTAGSVDDTIRLTIPRACRFVYEVASNRGGRHDPDEIDPNEMDAQAVVTQCSWILAEMIRHAQHGAASMHDAQEAVESLMRRRYPLIEEIDGRTYFHGKGASATDVAMVILLQKYPTRLHPDELISLLVSNKFSLNYARTAVARIDRYLDHDSNGKVVLLGPGLQRAEEILRDASAD
jgi:hypothetical protein